MKTRASTSTRGMRFAVAALAGGVAIALVTTGAQSGGDVHAVAFGISSESDDGAHTATAIALSEDLDVGLDIVAWFVDWTQPFPTVEAEEASANGWTTAIFWEPWDHTRGSDQRPYAPHLIARGDHDAYLQQWADDAAQFGGPVLLILAPEMNIPSSPWTPSSDATTDFVAAWRHVHELFADRGAGNVHFVWAPAAIDEPAVSLEAVFPGTDAVDAVGMTVFNGGSDLQWDGWRSFEELQRDTRRRIAELAPDEDVIYASVGSSEAGGDKAFWIRSMFETVTRDRKATALIWFNHDKETDWRINSSEPALAAIRAGTTAARRADRRDGNRRRQPLFTSEASGR